MVLWNIQGTTSYNLSSEQAYYNDYVVFSNVARGSQ